MAMTDENARAPGGTPAFVRLEHLRTALAFNPDVPTPAPALVKLLRKEEVLDHLPRDLVAELRAVLS